MNNQTIIDEKIKHDTQDAENTYKEAIDKLQERIESSEKTCDKLQEQLDRVDFGSLKMKLHPFEYAYLQECLETGAIEECDLAGKTETTIADMIHAVMDKSDAMADDQIDAE